MNFYRALSKDVVVQCEDPLLGVIDNFLSKEECQTVINAAKPLLKRSLAKDSNGKILESEQRTSSSAHLYQNQEVRSLIGKKVKTHFSFNEEELEALQVVNYENGQHFDVHHDCAQWDKVKGEQGDSFSATPRLVTILIYLNDINEGKDGHEVAEGMTLFPNIGYGVRPKTGRAVGWYNFDNNGVLDLRTLHTGLSVMKGEKWAINVWAKDDNLDVSKDITWPWIEKEFAKQKKVDKMELVL